MDMVRKHPDEAVLYTANFTRELGTGETLASVTSVTAYESGVVSSGLTIGTPVLATPSVQMLVSGGTHGHIYVLVFKGVSSAGQTLVVNGGVSVHR